MDATPAGTTAGMDATQARTKKLDMKRATFQAEQPTDVSVDEVIMGVVRGMNKRRTRAVDVFRKIEGAGDGVTADAFRGGLKTCGVEPSDEELTVLVDHLGKGTGSVTFKDFDRAVGKMRRTLTMSTVEDEAAATQKPEKVHLPDAVKRTPRSIAGKQTPREPLDKPPVAPVLEKLDDTDLVMLRIVGKLNERKYRAIDFFRTIDVSGDGLCTHAELREGLDKMDCKMNDEDFTKVVKRLDDDDSGDVDPKEFEQEIKLVSKKARAENRHGEVDTWPLKRPQEPKGRYSWAHRSVCTTSSASWSTYGTPASSKLPTPWSASSAGPTASAWSSLVGSGSVFDSSIHRQRLLDSLPAPGATPQSLHLSKLPLHRNGFWRSTHVGRFETDPTDLPHPMMMTTRDKCRTSTRGAFKSMPTGGVRTFQNTPMMQSTVDQVVFNRDMDYSGEEKFDEEFTQMFDGMAGMPSWFWGR
mmetsp:Transcript_40156/g.73016  ORF Transcript_40156/g.73016 Transcript_40156/m.73016 type:complete len:470 (-) Transcript_40156:70-1479(-)